MKQIMDELKIDGVLIVDKPRGWTSHDVCAFIRKHFHIAKVGHAGTLDPLATGILVLLLGRATKYSMDFTSSDKEYRGVMELGVKTDSHDRDGQVIQTAPWEHITLDQIREKALAFTGEILQVPPMVSALKHHGVRLYKLARKGQSVPREGRMVNVSDLKIEKKDGAFVHFFACVSKGTYLRTLINDLGDSLGSLACLAELRRVRSGRFVLDSGVTVEALKQMTVPEFRDKVLPLHTVIPHGNPQRS